MAVTHSSLSMTYTGNKAASVHPRQGGGHAVHGDTVAALRQHLNGTGRHPHVVVVGDQVVILSPLNWEL